ncbi:hypothetical protein OKA05_28480 [Luteolibacter arcticus]|uniref:SURF1-like protein n=1 Tax=Luteolibacter arcticus TaxID=1581411 RepID=A0ABT3GSN3_9BACT|nr:hypothetical protein [Luteolibacter arcticus]MCW1926522.1 hypothetical protein [Luteolibacter arcticus]
MSVVRQIVFWVALFFAGVWVVSVVTSHSAMAGAGAGMGRFSYWFRFTLEPYPSGGGDDELMGRVIIEGRAPPRWMKFGGVSPRYREVSLEWAMFSGVRVGETGGTCSIDLTKHEIVSGADRLPLDRENLGRLFGFAVAPEESMGFLDELLGRLEECRSGTLPRPRHHTYRFDEGPIRGRLQHFASGFSLSYPELVWAGVWLFMVLGVTTGMVLRRRRSSRKQSGSLTG